MRRAFLIGAFALPWAVLAYLGWDALRDPIDFSSADTTARHLEARSDFFAGLAFRGCVDRTSVLAEASELGWSHRDVEAPGFCHSPALNNWLVVQIEPPLPFSTDDENAAYIGFDANGCMAAWDFTTCD